MVMWINTFNLTVLVLSLMATNHLAHAYTTNCISLRQARPLR